MKQTPRKESRIHHSGPTDEEQFAFAPTEQMQVIDLNHATERQLLSIEGVSDELVHAIIEHRTHCGHFRSWDDVTQVPGVSGEALECIRRASRIGGA
jgi:DNA uptake protein ComE-like DNA-binding protein